LNSKLLHGLSKREWQIMEIVYMNRSVSVQAVLDRTPGPPHYPSRYQLQPLIEKVRREELFGGVRSHGSANCE